MWDSNSAHSTCGAIHRNRFRYSRRRDALRRRENAMKGLLVARASPSPGSGERMLAKAAGLEADQVFLRPLDSVAPSLKNDDTRAAVARALTDQTWKAQTKAVRVNAVGTPWCLDDILGVVSRAGKSLDCIMLPKVESAAQVHFAAHASSSISSVQDTESSGRSGSKFRSSRRAVSSRSRRSRLHPSASRP